MFLNTVCSFIFRWSGRTVLLYSFALLLAAHTNSSASSFNPSVDVPLIPAAAVVAAPVAGSSIVQDGKVPFANSTSSHTGVVKPLPVETSAGESPGIAVADNRKPDWDGVWRDTGVLFVSQIAVTGVIYLMPESVSSWSREQRTNGFKKYDRNVVDPVIDKDKFYINYLIHPYWGATYYIRGRERGLDKTSSFIYSALLSAMFEFGIESIFEKPSLQDLLVTPIAGSLLGSAVFEPWRRAIKNKPDLSWYDHAALVATDPVGVLSSGFEKLLGIKPAIMVDYSIANTQKSATNTALTPHGNRIGVVLRFPIN